MNIEVMRNGLRAVLRPTNMIGGVALLVVVASALFADSQNRIVGEQQLRASVSRQLSIVRTRLEANINGNLQLVRGLVSAVTTEPDMTASHFADLASHLFEGESDLRDIVLAPDLKVTTVYPLKGNEKVVGVDYNDIPDQRAMAYAARDTGQLVFVGPVKLVQGGEGFVARFPVFTATPSHPRAFWGLVSAVIDSGELYSESGLTGGDLDIDVAISGPASSGNGGSKVFFGDDSVPRDRPVLADVSLPQGFWQIAARPTGGWEAALPNPLGFRLILAIAAALVLFPLVLARFLIEQRAVHIRGMAERQHQLDIVSRRLGLALEVSEEGVWEFNVADQTAVWDDRMNVLFGLPPDGAPRTDQHWRNAVHPDDLPAAQREIDNVIASRGRYVVEYRIRRANDGAERMVRAIGSCYEDVDGSLRLVGCNWDVTDEVNVRRDLERAKALTEARNVELVAATARIEHTSLHDALTKLPNRRYLDRVLEERAQICRRDDTGIALLHIDLDRFKQINDTLGHAAGDAMLVHTADILRANVREEDFVARIGGDEFVVVSALRAGGRRELSKLAARIVADMRQPFPYMGHECRTGVSIGIAYQRGAKVDDKRLLIDADIALYRAKRRGRNRHEFFTEALQAEIVSNKRLADEILVGLEQGQFIAWYQPQIDARTLRISGVEALARWEHPRRGIVAPDQFLPIAEDLNVVATLDRMVLEQTLSWMAIWKAQGLEVPHASVNVSARRLRDDSLIRSLRKLDIESGRISFELVESIYLDESDDVVAFNIDQIRELGIDIEIDDFGTGYASIVSLLKLKPRRLKIDRQLVMPVTETESQRQLVASIVDIGHSLGIGVVAEGVETEEHARIATELGCDALQGYAFSKPLSPADLERFLADWQRRDKSRAA
jgi:diguanylate cyclase (GGDEF)-like protein